MKCSTTYSFFIPFTEELEPLRIGQMMILANPFNIIEQEPGNANSFYDRVAMHCIFAKPKTYWVEIQFPQHFDEDLDEQFPIFLMSTKPGISWSSPNINGAANELVFHYSPKVNSEQ